MLLIEVFCNAGLIEHFDPRPYSSDWFLHRSEEVFEALVAARAHRVERASAQPGDVVLLRVGHCLAHGGIVTAPSPLAMIHAYRLYGQVIEEVVSTNADVEKRMKSAQFYSYWPA